MFYLTQFFFVYVFFVNFPLHFIFVPPKNSKSLPLLINLHLFLLSFLLIFAYFGPDFSVALRVPPSYIRKHVASESIFLPMKLLCEPLLDVCKNFYPASFFNEICAPVSANHGIQLNCQFSSTRLPHQIPDTGLSNCTKCVFAQGGGSPPFRTRIFTFYELGQIFHQLLVCTHELSLFFRKVKVRGESSNLAKTYSSAKGAVLRCFSPKLVWVGMHQHRPYYIFLLTPRFSATSSFIADFHSRKCRSSLRVYKYPRFACLRRFLLCVFLYLPQGSRVHPIFFPRKVRSVKRDHPSSGLSEERESGLLRPKIISGWTKDPFLKLPHHVEAENGRRPGKRLLADSQLATGLDPLSPWLCPLPPDAPVTGDLALMPQKVPTTPTEKRMIFSRWQGSSTMPQSRATGADFPLVSTNLGRRVK